MSNKTDELIATTIKSLFATLLHDLQAGGNVPNLGMMDFPEKPRTLKGRGKGPHTGKSWQRVTVSLDETLVNLMNDECRTKRESLSRIIESALWVRYGRPRLSYQRDTE